MAKKKPKKTDELSELDSAYKNMVGDQPAAKGSKVSIALICAACAVLFMILAAGVWLLFSDNWLVMKDVTVAGIHMEGMTKKEAKAALEALVDEHYSTQTMQVTVLDHTAQLPADKADISIDVNEAINKAYHQSSGVFDLTPYITAGSGLQELVDEFGVLFNADLSPTTYTLEGIKPSLTTGTPEEGTGQTLILQLGTPKMALDTKQLYQDILTGYSTANFQVTGKCVLSEPEMPTAQDLYNTYLTAPVNAAMDPKTFQITPEVYGYSVDPDQAAALLADAGYGDLLSIPFATIAPEETLATLEAYLYQDILGECTTLYSGSDTNNRNTNLGLCCEKINGLVLLPGETFSYNQVLGERTAAAGWKPAASYVGGETVDTYGGGICQGSSTLYNCVLQADLKIVERYNHGYISAYTLPGLDATVSWGTLDFRFTNSTSSPIKIEAFRKDGKMTMRIHGIDEKDYTVKMTYYTVPSAVVNYKTVYKDIDPENNPKGYKDGQVITTPYIGYTVYTYKNRYDKETGELLETVQEAKNVYSKRDQVIARFVTQDAESEKTE